MPQTLEFSESVLFPCKVVNSFKIKKKKKKKKKKKTNKKTTTKKQKYTHIDTEHDFY